MIYGFDRITQPLDSFTWLFRYKGLYYPKSTIIKNATEWTQVSRSTKYRILNDPNRWAELENYGIAAVLAEKVGETHYITTDGTLLSTTFREVCKNNESYVEFIEGGKAHRIFRASLVIKAFLDPDYDIVNDKPYYLDRNTKNAALANIVVSDPDKARRKKK